MNRYHVIYEIYDDMRNLNSLNHWVKTQKEAVSLANKLIGLHYPGSPQLSDTELKNGVKWLQWGNSDRTHYCTIVRK